MSAVWQFKDEQQPPVLEVPFLVYMYIVWPLTEQMPVNFTLLVTCCTEEVTRVMCVATWL